MKKVLSYIANYFVFRSGPIGYLYDICQEFPVVLISEKLDPETEETVKNKSFFPKLEKIIPIRQSTGKKENLFQKNIYLYKLAKDVLEKENPDIVVCSSDTHPLFELYLMRFAKRKKIIKIAIQTGNVGDNKIIERRVDLTNAYLRFPGFLPFCVRLRLVKLRKYLGHILYYWILPVLVGETPFFGKSSYILYKGNSGMRDSDFQTVFSKKDFDIFLKDGVPKEKLHIVSHPLNGESKDFFYRAFWRNAKRENQKKNIVVLLPEDKIGFRRADDSLIPEKDVFTTRKEILNLIVKILEDWIIYLKPHPDIVDIQGFLRPFIDLGENIRIIDKQEPLDKYIETSDAILELPLSAGTALFTAALQCPEKPVISLDFHREILGDYYKNTAGIEYVDNLADLSNLLQRIKNGVFRKEKTAEISEKKEGGFKNMAEFLIFLISKKEKN